MSGPVDFGGVTIGSTATKNVVLSNTGTGPLTVSGISVGPLADVVTLTSSSPRLPFDIPAGGSYTLGVVFTPTQIQSYVGSLKVTTDSTSAVNDVLEVRGTGLPLPKAKLEWLEPLIYTCIPEYCYDMVVPIVNTGDGCAVDPNVVMQAYGGGGAGPAIGVPVPLLGYGYFFRPGQTIRLRSMSGFNDVRSVNTKFKATISWRDVPCQ